jgi:hypothetical protein
VRKRCGARAPQLTRGVGRASGGDMFSGSGPRIILFVLSVVLISSPATGELAVPTAITSATIAWDPAVLSFSPECATTWWQTQRSALCIVEPVLDKSGNLHLFIAQRPLGTGASVDRHIEHLLLSDNEVHHLPSIPIVDAPAIAFRAVATHTGDLQLLWVEDRYWNPKYHEQAMYLETYHAGTWQNRRPVLDGKAELFVLGSEDIALRASEDGSLDIFWKDLREHHPLAGLLSVCDDGHRSKTYHRRLTGDYWGDTERVQPKGNYEPYAFRVPPVGVDPPDVYWSETSGGIARVIRSSYSQGRWQVKETIGQCKASLDRPEVFDFAVTSDIEGHARVAWLCSRFEYTVPGTRRNDLFNILYLSAPDKGAWTTGPEISRNATHLRWLWDTPLRSVLLIQERESRLSSSKAIPVPLLVASADRAGSVTREIIAKESVGGFAEAIADETGTIHVIYIEPTSGTKAILKYRRGQYQGG